LLNFKKLAATDVLAQANGVHDGVFIAAKENYPNSPVDEATFKSQIDALSQSITAALHGSKKAIAAREHSKGVVIKSMRQIGHYVEVASNDDMTTFLKSGFKPHSTTRTVTQPVSDHIRKIGPGKNSGSMKVVLVAQADALAYQLRRAPIGQGGALGDWVEQLVGKTRPSALVTGLTPGTNYAFQVRSLTDSGYSDWSESVTRIVT